jgi:transposase
MEVPFAIDWEHQQATCPQGRTSRSWTSIADTRGNPLIRVHFSTTNCGHCPVQSLCIHSAEKYKRRTLTLRPQAQHEALLAARKFQQTTAFTRQYHLREGIEATISESEFEPLACVVLAILERQKRIYSTWALLPLSISAA